MRAHKYQLYLFELHSKSFKSKSILIGIPTEGKCLMMKFGPSLYYRVNTFDYTKLAYISLCCRDVLDAMYVSI